MTPSAVHSEADIDHLIHALNELWNHHALVKNQRSLETGAA